MKRTTIALAAALVLAPLGASAFSVDSMSNISNGGSYDVASGPFFWDATFTGADGAGSVVFDFANTSSSSTTLGLAQGTVLQFSGQFDGVTASWANGQSQSVAPGENAIINISSLLAQGTSDLLTISWGNVTGSRANIDIDVAAVPLPAGAALLGTALLGFGAFSRRRNAV